MARASKNDDMVEAKFLAKSTAKKAGMTTSGKKVTSLSNIQKLYIAGGVLDATGKLLGSMATASAIRMQGKYEEAAYMENARRTRRAAKHMKETGQKDALSYMEEIRKLEGAQKAAMAASGVEVDSGVGLDVRQETVERGIENATQIKLNAYMQAFGLEQQGIEQEHAAAMTRIGRKFEEKSTLLTGRYQTVQSVLGTGTRMMTAGSAK